MYPMLVPGYVIIPMEDGSLNLRRGRRSLVLRGQMAEIARRVLDYLDGVRSLDELTTLTGLGRKQLDAVVRRLSVAELITDPTATLPRGDPLSEVATALEVFAASNGEQGHLAFRTLQQQRLALVGEQDIACRIRELLVDSGVGSVEWIGGEADPERIREMRPTFLIQSSPAPDYCACLEINALAFELHFPWLAAWIEDPHLIVTHVVAPGETACFECLLTRQRRNYQHYEADLAYEQYQRLRREPGVRQGASATIEADVENGAAVYTQATSPFAAHLLAGLAATRAIGHLVGLIPGPPVPFLLEFSLQRLDSTTHPVLRLPRCPTCGTSAVRQGPAPFVLDADAEFRKHVIVAR